MVHMLFGCDALGRIEELLNHHTHIELPELDGPEVPRGTAIRLPDPNPVSLFHRETRRTFPIVRPSLQQSFRAY